MNHRQGRRALYRAEEETTGGVQKDTNDWFKHRGEDFWHSVWKRIESGQPRNEGQPVREFSEEVPLDYVADREARA